MKATRFFPLLLLVVFAACSPVRVATDYDREANFNQYQTYAFFRPGIDKAEISDLDKKRILRAIESEMSKKGFTKSENPDILFSIFTKARERVDVYYSHYGWGSPWGWRWGHPWAWHTPAVATTTETTLYIDIIDAKTNELVWQGKATAPLARTMEEKEERISEMVMKNLEHFPPQR